MKLLGIDDLFEGITFCDYAEPVLLCKPQSGMFDKAMEQAGISENKECYFVGKYRCQMGCQASRERTNVLEMIRISIRRQRRREGGTLSIFWTSATRSRRLHRVNIG